MLASLILPHPTLLLIVQIPLNPLAIKSSNIIVYGINECPEGSTRHTRITKDMEDVTKVIQKADPSIPSNSIRNCVSLGKYTNRNRRPILVKLSRSCSCSCEVTSILANHKKLTDTPMSKEERVINPRCMHCGVTVLE